MRRSLIFLSFTLLFFFLPVSSIAQKLEKNTPDVRLRLEENSWDFGYIPNFMKVSHIFHIENQGRDTLIITRVRSDCGCTHIPLRKSWIGPKEKTELELIFDPSKFHGPIQKAVSIMSNDMATPLSDILFTAQVGLKNPMVRLNPEGIFFDTLTSSQERMKEIELENISEEKFFISVVQGPQEFVDYGIGKFELGPREKTQIYFKTRPPLPSGLIRTSLTLEFKSSGKSRCTIPIQGVVSR